MEGISAPVAGFFGLIHEWIDLDLLEHIISNNPGVNFVFIGECSVDVGRLVAYGNAHFLGQKKYSDLIVYARHFDIGLIPFKVNELTVNVNPIKLREYLAAGLPVVSTPLPEATAYRPDVLVAADSAEFCRCCDQALADSDPDARRRRSARVADESWEAVVDRLSGIVGSVIEQSGRAAGVPAAPTGPPAAVETPVLVESVV